MADPLDEPQTSASFFSAMEGFGGLSIFRQIMLLVGLAASIATGFYVVLVTQEPDYRPLYTDISHLEAGQVADLLQKEEIQFKVDTNSSMLLVESSRVHDARMLLAAQGFPSGKALGYELLDKEQSIGTSQFMEKARYHRSLEGELARTVSSMTRVRKARVHLAIPKRSVFVGDKRQPSASVFLEVYPGHSLNSMQVASIVHLVASSIPQLKEGAVTVVDQLGNLLTESDKNTDIARAAKNFEYSRKMEEMYIGRVNTILEPLLGREGFKVQVSTDIDFSVTEQTAELFNPDLPAVRSEQTLSEFAGADGGAMGIPGALSNQPPGAVSAPEQSQNAAALAEASAASNVRRQSSRNFELDRTISHTRHQVGQLKRLSVAVVADYQTVPSEKKEDETKQALTVEQIERITLLVKDAVGFNAARGDRVSIINQPFKAKELVMMEDIPEPDWWLNPTYAGYGRQLGGFFLIIILFFAFLRPIFKGLAAGGQSSGLMSLETQAGSDLGFGEPVESDVTLSGLSNPLLPGPDASYEQHLDAVKSIVAEDPKRVAQVVKTWLAND